MKIYAELPKGRGFVVRVARGEYQGHPTVDVRTWYEARPGDPDTRRPSPKGVTISLAKLPELIEALRQMEADAMQAGLLRKSA
jgi:hypothetical protein